MNINKSFILYTLFFLSFLLTGTASAFGNKETIEITLPSSVDNGATVPAFVVVNKLPDDEQIKSVTLSIPTNPKVNQTALTVEPTQIINKLSLQVRIRMAEHNQATLTVLVKTTRGKEYTKSKSVSVSDLVDFKNSDTIDTLFTLDKRLFPSIKIGQRHLKFSEIKNVNDLNGIMTIIYHPHLPKSTGVSANLLNKMSIFLSDQKVFNIHFGDSYANNPFFRIDFPKSILDSYDSSTVIWSDEKGNEFKSSSKLERIN